MNKSNVDTMIGVGIVRDVSTCRYKQMMMMIEK